jgi:hypothetical protein
MIVPGLGGQARDLPQVDEVTKQMEKLSINKGLIQLPTALQLYIRSFLGLDDGICLSTTSKRLKASEKTANYQPMPSNAIASQFVNKMAKKHKTISKKVIRWISERIDPKSTKSIQIDAAVTPLFLKQVAKLFPNTQSLRLNLSRDAWLESEMQRQKYIFHDFIHLTELSIGEFPQSSVAAYLVESYVRHEQEGKVQLQKGRLVPVPQLLTAFGARTTQCAWSHPDRIEPKRLVDLVEGASQDFRTQMQEIFANACASDYIRDVLDMKWGRTIPEVLPVHIQHIADLVTMLTLDGRRVVDELLDAIADFFPNLKVLVIEGSADGYDTFEKFNCTFEKFNCLEELRAADLDQEKLARRLINRILMKGRFFFPIPNLLQHCGKKMENLGIDGYWTPRFLSDVIKKVCPQVQSVELDGQREEVCELLPIVATLPHLKHLRFFGGFRGKHFDKIPEAIETLELTNCPQIDEACFQNLHLPHLKKVIVEKENLRLLQYVHPELQALHIGSVPASELSQILKRFSKLKELSVCLSQDGSLQFLESVSPKIERMALIGSRFGKEVDENILKRHLERFDHLRHINLSSESITGACLQNLTTPAIRSLEISSTCFDEQILLHPKLQKVQKLRMSRCTLTKEAIQHIVSFKSLKYLEIDGTCLTDETVNLFSTMRQLEQLYLSGNRPRKDLLQILKKRLPHVEIIPAVQSCRD